MKLRRDKTRSAGFTLIEAAMTIAIVGIALSAVMQALEGAKLTAAHTLNSKLARELGMMTLGEIEHGLWWDDIETLHTGSYADQDHPEFYFELALGAETFFEYDDEEDPYRQFDNWAYQRERDLENADRTEDEEDEEAIEPYEQVRIRVTFPKLRNFDNEIVLERWIRWEQAYGEDEEEEAATETGEPGDGGAEGAGPGSGSEPR